MITFAFANYYSMAHWPICPKTTTESSQYSYDDVFGPINWIGKTHSYNTVFHFGPNTSRINSVGMYIGCQYADLTGIFLTFFLAILMCQNISGSHFNPMITVICTMFPIEREIMDYKLAYLYVIAQGAGAFTAALLQKAFAAK